MCVPVIGEQRCRKLHSVEVGPQSKITVEFRTNDASFEGLLPTTEKFEPNSNSTTIKARVHIML